MHSAGGVTSRSDAGGTGPNFTPDSIVAYAHPDLHVYSGANGDTHCDTNPYAHFNAYCHPDTYANCDSHFNTHSLADPNSYVDTYTYSNGNAHPNGHANAHTYSFRTANNLW